MDINPLFKLFAQYANYVKSVVHNANVYLHVTPVGTGYVSIIDNGEQMTHFSWETHREGLHKFREQIKIIKDTKAIT